MKKSISLILLVCSNIILAQQPGTKVKELYRDRYTVEGGRYGHPYTTFDKNLELTKTLANIKTRIKAELDTIGDDDGPILLAYQQVYNNAIEPRPTDDGMITYNAIGKPTIPSRLALWAKNNAFVMLVGLNGNSFNFLNTKN